MDIPGQPSFREQIASVHQLLLPVSEQESQRSFREGGWSRKEILGHLIDSALNNHQRFVRAALDGSYEGPSYQQEGWVAMHGYKCMAWRVLLDSTGTLARAERTTVRSRGAHSGRALRCIVPG